MNRNYNKYGGFVLNSNSNKINLLVKLTFGTCLITSNFSNALTIIDANNIGEYTEKGIAVTTDDIVIQNLTDSSLPHINLAKNKISAIKSQVAGKKITIDSGLDEFVIQTNGAGNYNSAFNIHAHSGGKVDVLSDIRLNVQDGTGIYLASGGKGNFAKKVIIDGTGVANHSFIGIRAYNGSNTIKTDGNFDGEVIIQSIGDSSYGILSLLNNNPNAIGINLNFNDKVTINMTGANSVGVSAQEQVGANPNADSVINFNNGLDVITANGNAIEMEQSAGKISINSGTNTNNIVSVNHNSHKAIYANTGQVTVQGKSYIKGDIYAKDKGQIDLDLTDGSLLLTAINNALNETPEEKGNINVTMTGSQSQWRMTDSSYIDSLILNNNAKISFGYDYETPNRINNLNGSNSMLLTANSLSGNGLFELRTSLGNNFANDLIKITGSLQATGEHNISIKDDYTGSAMVNGNEKMTLVETEGGGAKFNLISPSIDIGPYQFNKLTKVTNERNNGSEDWVLSATNSESANPIKPSKPHLTNTAQNAANILNSNYLLSYIETQTLHQRMGKLRRNETVAGDAWGHIYSGKLSSFNDNRLSDFAMNYYGLQLGIDRRIEDNRQDVYYGFMGGYSRGNIDHHVGDGNTTGYYAAIYGTILDQSGLYIDALAKYMIMKNKFNTTTGGGYLVKGDGNTNGVSIGIEVGQRFYLSPALNSNQGWYIEPQTQLTYSRQGSTVIKATNGLRTELNSYNSLHSRASIILGNNFSQDNNIIDVYLKTGYVKEFAGQTSYVFNNTAKEKYDFAGNWWDNGIGVNMQFNNHHNIYADVVYSLGNKFDQKQVNMGYRYSFS